MSLGPEDTTLSKELKKKELKIVPALMWGLSNSFQIPFYSQAKGCLQPLELCRSYHFSSMSFQLTTSTSHPEPHCSPLALCSSRHPSPPCLLPSPFFFSTSSLSSPSLLSHPFLFSSPWASCASLSPPPTSCLHRCRQSHAPGVAPVPECGSWGMQIIRSICVPRGRLLLSPLLASSARWQPVSPALQQGPQPSGVPCCPVTSPSSVFPHLQGSIVHCSPELEDWVPCYLASFPKGENNNTMCEAPTVYLAPC